MKDKEIFYDNIIFQIGKYTAIPAILAFVIKIPDYDERVIFALFALLNWIVLIEFKIRDVKNKLYCLLKEKNLRRKMK